MQIKILISAILLFSATMAFAEKFGENVEAVINGETLIISGTGDMYNFSYTSSSRFGNIKKVKTMYTSSLQSYFSIIYADY